MKDKNFGNIGLAAFQHGRMDFLVAQVPSYGLSAVDLFYGLRCPPSIGLSFGVGC